jgi:hypothetical protein
MISSYALEQFATAKVEQLAHEATARNQSRSARHDSLQARRTATPAEGQPRAAGIASAIR